MNDSILNAMAAKGLRIDPDYAIEQLMELAPEEYAAFVRDILKDFDIEPPSDVSNFARQYLSGEDEHLMRQVSKDPILPWNFKPKNIYPKIDTKNGDMVYLGAEFEFATKVNGNDVARAVYAMNKGPIADAVCKYDSSIFRDENDPYIKPNGFEVVTRPMSMNVLNKYIDDLFSQSFATHLVALPTCGMHVHVSRKPLSDPQIAKIVVFVNQSANKEFIRIIAGRTYNKYCQMKAKELRSAHMSTDRYEAVNVTGKATIEFRIFEATTNPRDMKARIEFCRALVEYFSRARTKFNTLDWMSFVDWVHNTTHKYKYSNLKSYLLDHVEA